MIVSELTQLKLDTHHSFVHEVAEFDILTLTVYPHSLGKQTTGTDEPVLLVWYLFSFFFFTAEDVVWGIIKAVPFVAATGAAAYFYYKAVTVKDSGRVNMSLKKDLECVVSTAFIEDIGDQTSFCRCWRSSKVQLLLDTWVEYVGESLGITISLKLNNVRYFFYSFLTVMDLTGSTTNSQGTMLGHLLSRRRSKMKNLSQVQFSVTLSRNCK